MPVWTAAQTNNFFENELGIPTETWNQMQTIGINNVETLVDYDETLLKALRDDLRKPAGTMADPNDAARVVPRTPFVLSPVSFHRLTIAVELVKYYVQTGRDRTPGNMSWNGPLRNFSMYLKARDEGKDESTTAPVMTRNTPFHQWAEAMELHLEQTWGAMNIPLAYVIRSNATIGPAPPLAMNKPYSTEHGSVVNELIARASHTHDLFDHDNAEVFVILSSSLQGSTYAATISSFKRRRDGRAAWTALISQHLGRDKWEKEVKKQENFLLTFVWKGNSNMTLESYVNKHRMAFIRIQQCAEHITHTVPSDRQRVTYMLDGIKCQDATLMAAIANVRADDAGKMNSFEDASAYIIPSDPVSSKRNTVTKRKYDDMNVSAVDLGDQRGTKTGVEVRFYKPHEYRCLTKEQKQELKELRQKNGNRGNNGRSGAGGGGKKGGNNTATFDKKNKKAHKKAIAAITKHVIAALNQSEDTDKDDETDETDKDMVVSALMDLKTKQVKISENETQATKATTSNNNNLKSILLRGRRS